MLNNIVGSFHLLMSFLGAIGYIMGGSGLKDIWSIIYAVGSIPHMLSGNAGLLKKLFNLKICFKKISMNCLTQVMLMQEL